MLIKILAIIGAITSAAFIGGMLAFVWVCLEEFIDKAKRKYRYKHRFDKPPTAKCYCIDCRHHDNETGLCYRFGETTKEYRCTADNWFCWEADPCEKEKQ